MAFSAITPIGSNVSDASGTTLAVSPSANLTVGKVVFVSCTTDNVQTTDGNTTLHSLASNPSNTWTKVFEYTNSGAAAAGGNTTSLWYSVITTQIGTANSITLTTGSAVVDKIISILEATISAGTAISFETPAVNETLTATLSGLTSREYLFFGLNGAEGEDTTKSPNANYTEQFDLVSSTSGLPAVNVQQHVQTRILTGTGDTCDVSGITYTDSTHSLTAFYESGVFQITGACTIAVTSSQADIKGKGTLTNNTTTVAVTVTGNMQDGTISTSPITGAISIGITVAGTIPNRPAKPTITSIVTDKSPITGNISLAITTTAALVAKGSLSAAINASITTSANLGEAAPPASQITGAITLSLSVEANIVAKGNLTANIPTSVSITGTVLGKGTLVGAISLGITTSANLTAKGLVGSAIISGLTVTGDIKAKGRLISNISIIISVSGTLLAKGSLTGNISAPVTISGSISGKAPITAAVQISASTTASLLAKGLLTSAIQVGITVTGSVNGKATLSGTLNSVISALADIIGKGSVSGALSTSLQNTGSLIGSGALTGSISIPILVDGSLSGTTTTSQITGTCSIAIATSGDIIGKGLVTGTIDISVFVSGDIENRPAKPTIIDVVPDKSAITGIIDISISTSADVKAIGSLTGAISLSINTTGDIRNGSIPVSEITGTINIGLSVSGDVTGKGIITSSTNISVGTSGEVVGRGALQSIANSIVITSIGSLLAKGSISSSITTSFTVYGDLTEKLFPSPITASGNITFQSAGSLHGKGSILGGSVLEFQASANIKAIGSVTGLGTLQFIGTAIIRRGSIEVVLQKLVYKPIEIGINLDLISLPEIFIDLDKKSVELSIFIDKNEVQNLHIDLEPRLRSLDMKLQEEKTLVMDINI